MRIIADYIADEIVELKQELDSAAIVATITAAVSASLAFIPYLIYVALAAMAAIIIILIADIIVTAIMDEITTFYTELEDLMSDGAFIVHDNTVFSFIANMHETTSCFNKVVSFHEYGSNIISAFNDLRSSSNHYDGVRDYFHYEQRDLVQPIYDLWTSEATTFTKNTFNKLVTATFGLVGDSDTQVNIHRFVVESTYSNPWIYNLIHRLDWGDIPLDDWYDNEMGTDGTAAEMSIFYNLAIDKGAPI